MTFDCKEQLAGVATLDFYLLTECDNFPEVLTDVNANEVTYDPEINNVEATIQPDSITTNFNNRVSANGELWQPNLSAKFITISEALEQLLDQYANKPGIAILCLNNGFKKMVGSNLEPLYLNYTTNEGATIDDSNASTTITITGKMRQRPVYITA